jgi:hypothetical protein
MVTLSVYAHVLPSSDEYAADAVQRALGLHSVSSKAANPHG